VLEFYFVKSQSVDVVKISVAKSHSVDVRISVVESQSVDVRISVAKSKSVGVRISFVESQSVGVKICCIVTHDVQCKRHRILCLVFKYRNSYSVILFYIQKRTHSISHARSNLECTLWRARN